MAADLSYWIGMAGFAAAVVVVCAVFVHVCILMVKACWRSRPIRGMRLSTLGGVTTLQGEALSYDCAAMCRHSLQQREEARTLSCGHVFHLRKGPNCASNIDDWLPENRMRCPACCKPVVHHVLPTLEGTADIGATARARATASEVGAVVVDFGFGGSGAAADAGATAAAGVGPGATAVSAVDVVPGRATVWVAAAVKSKDASSSLDGTALERLLWPVWITSSRGSSRILSFLFPHSWN